MTKIYYFDSYGKRQEKYDRLDSTNIGDIDWKELELKAPFYLFSSNKGLLDDKYNDGFKVDEIFNKFSTGIQSGNDDLFIGESEDILLAKLSTQALEHVGNELVSELSYRIFDKKFVYYIKNFQSNKFQNILVPKSYRSRYDVMNNFNYPNIGMIIGRQGQAVGTMEWNLVFSVNSVSDLNLFYRGGGSIFPLYIYNSDSQTSLEDQQERTPNFNMETLAKIEKKLGMKMTPLSLPFGEI